MFKNSIATAKRKARTIDQIKAEKNRRCPWGCAPDAGENEVGYCKHLAGWTNDGKTFQPREYVQVTEGFSKEQPAKGLVLVEASDRIVDMGNDYKRVYRWPGQYPLKDPSVEVDTGVAPDPVSQAAATDEARDAKIAAQDKEIAEMKATIAKMLKAGAKQPTPAPTPDN